MITQEYLKSRLYYHPETGQFVWLKTLKFCHKNRIGTIAGSVASTGYIQILINGKTFKAHRLAFLYMTGLIPESCDHINRIRHDNMWSNLRPATKSQNAINCNIHSSNTSGYIGVTWSKAGGKCLAQISFQKKRMYLGLFECPLKASNAYQSKRKELFGEFAIEGE